MVDLKNSQQRARVAVAGLGAIGAAVVRELDRGIEGLALATVSAQNIEKHRAWLDAKGDVALKDNGPGKEFTVAEKDCAATGRVASVDGLLDGGSVERLAVPGCAVFCDVADRTAG